MKYSNRKERQRKINAGQKNAPSTNSPQIPDKRRKASGDSQSRITSERTIRTSFDETGGNQTHHNKSPTERDLPVSPTTRALSVESESLFSDPEMLPDQMLHDLMSDVAVQDADTFLPEFESRYRFTAGGLHTFDSESTCLNLSEHAEETIDVEDSSKIALCPD